MPKLHLDRWGQSEHKEPAQKQTELSHDIPNKIKNMRDSSA